MGVKNYGDPPAGWGCRHTIAVLISFASAVSYSMRFNLSIAIVAMVAPKKHVEAAYIFGNSSIACPNLLEEYAGFQIRGKTITTDRESSNTMGLPLHGEFGWSEVEQGVILGSYFWGYILTQIPGGILTKKYGGKWPLGIGLLVSALFALLTPWAARTSKELLILTRVLQGMGSGMHICSEMSLLAAWAPPNERSTLGAIAYGGTYIGTAVTLIISGYLIHEEILGGWPAVFYMSGHATILWFVLWVLCAFNSPAEHSRISREEKNYLDCSIGLQNGQTPSVPTPWKDVLRSMPMWANVVAQVAHCWVIYTLLTEMPTYMNTVLHFDIRKNSWMSAMPYLTSAVFGIVFGNLVDGILKSNKMSIVSVRKMAQLVAHAGSAVALIGAAYSGCDRVFAVAFLVSAVALSGAANSGFLVNYVDLTPNHAGMIMGAVNTVANICGVGAPYVAGLMINNNPSVENWQNVFLLSAGIFFCSAIFYTAFASGDEQSWNQFLQIEYDADAVLPHVKNEWANRNAGRDYVILWED